VIYANVFDDVIKAIEDGLNSALLNPSIVLLNIVAFVILVFIVKKFFWSKVTLFIEKRQTVIMEALESANKERARALELQEKSSQDYEAMKLETQKLKERLTKEAYRQQEELIQKAKQDAQRRLDQAQKDIAFEIEQANEDIKQSIKEVAFTAARKIVKREIDESIHQDIIDEALKERS
jgi:F-type H+-transporting ATPase subunit b